MWLPPDALLIPDNEMPYYAPLPRPMVQHLIFLEYQGYYHILETKRPSPLQIRLRVLSHVQEARSVVFDLMNPMVKVDERHHTRKFPRDDWIVNMLAWYAPGRKRMKTQSLNDWQRRGILLREYPRGPYDLNRIAALLIARIAEGGERLRNWLPDMIEAHEPQWWCYSKQTPESEITVLPIPLPLDLPRATFLWTPFPGASWHSERWRQVDSFAAAWYGFLTFEDIELWDEVVASHILEVTRSLQFGRDAVKQTMTQEAQNVVLEKWVSHVRNDM